MSVHAGQLLGGVMTWYNENQQCYQMTHILVMLNLKLNAFKIGNCVTAIFLINGRDDFLTALSMS